MGKPFNRAEEIVASAPGLGSITLGGHTGRGQTFAASGVVNGDVISYVIANSDETQWEVHVNVLYSSSAPQLPRTGLVASSAGGAAVPFGADAIVYIDAVDVDFHRKKSFSTVSEFQGSFVGFDVLTAFIEGYTTAGKGAFKVRRVSSQPSHLWRFQTQDRFLPTGAWDITNGGWWEGYSENGWIFVEQFGAVADGVTDDWQKITNALTYAKTVNVQGSTSDPMVRIGFLGNKYYSSDTIVIDKPAKLYGFHFEYNSGDYAEIIFPVNKTGIYVKQAAGNMGAYLEGLSLITPAGGSSAGVSGIYAEARIVCKHLYISGFAYYGIWIDTQTHPGWIADRFNLHDIWIIHVGSHGIYTVGGDSNIGRGTLISVQESGGSAIYDSANFGSYWSSIQIAGCGLSRYQLIPGQKGAMVVGSDGNVYQAKPGASVLWSTTDPVTDVTATAWLRCRNFSTSTLPNWNNGDTYQAAPGLFLQGGAYATHIYVEAPFNPPFITDGNAVIFGGPGSAQYEQTESFIKTGTLFNYLGFFTSSGAGFRSLYKTRPRNTLQSQFDTFVGSQDPDSGDVFGTNSSLNTNFYWKLSWDFNSGNLTTNWQNGVYLIDWTSNNTIYTYGRVGTVPWMVGFRNGLTLGNNSDGRVIVQASAAPTSGEHARGEIVFNNAGTLSSAFGWYCTAGGTPGTWVPLSLLPIYPTTTVAGLASYSPSAGARCFVTDATGTMFMSPVVGGGSIGVPVVYDGTDWLIG